MGLDGEVLWMGKEKVYVVVDVAEDLFGGDDEVCHFPYGLSC